MKKPVLIEQYADNGEFSHWHLIEEKNGDVLWSSFPEETIAQGQKIIDFNDIHEKAKNIADQCKPCSKDFYSGIYQGVKITLEYENNLKNKHNDKTRN